MLTNCKELLNSYDESRTNTSAVRFSHGSIPTPTTPAMSAITRRVVSRFPRNARAFQITRASSSNSGNAPKSLEDSTLNTVPVASQAPNAPAVWSTNQRPRPIGRTGPRFEQANMELQPQPLSAMAMIADEPVRIVHGRKAVCDGGNDSRSLICSAA
jgi:NADH dehydrogenase (ubiquinone) Fe-S protein 6